jgi:hypothetical protein
MSTHEVEMDEEHCCFVLRVIALKGEQKPEAPDPSGMFVQAYDADGNDGLGHVEFTGDLTKALQFDELHAASSAIYAQSTLRPLRDDGEPNRPLTAYTIAVMQLPIELLERVVKLSAN